MPAPVELSEDRVRELADAIESAPDPADDRRLGGVRVPARDHVRLVPFNAGGGGPSRLVEVRDVSRTGIALVLAEPMDEGQTFDLKLPRAGGRAQDVLCTVRHCRPDGRGRFVVGAKFGTDWLNTLAATMSQSRPKKLPPGTGPANPPPAAPARRVESHVVGDEG